MLYPETYLFGILEAAGIPRARIALVLTPAGAGLTFSVFYLNWWKKPSIRFAAEMFVTKFSGGLSLAYLLPVL